MKCRMNRYMGKFTESATATRLWIVWSIRLPHIVAERSAAGYVGKAEKPRDNNRGAVADE